MSSGQTPHLELALNQEETSEKHGFEHLI